MKPKPKEKPEFTFVGPAISAADLSEIIKEVQRHGMAAGIRKHFELAEKHDKRTNDRTCP